MICPECKNATVVTDVAKVPYASEVWRRRKCKTCGYSMFTVEYEYKDPDLRFKNMFWQIRERSRK